MKKKYGFSASGVRNHLRTLEARFYKNCFKYDGSTKKWVTTDRGFLTRELLEPEEVIVLNGIYRNKDRLGSSLSKTHVKMIEDYLKRTKSYVYKQHTAEEMAKDMEEVFAMLKSAINQKNIVEIEYLSKGNISIRRVFPYQVVYIEYYWYLICYEESKKIKSFRLSMIQSSKILDEIYNYDFKPVDLRLKLAMNAYVDFEEPIDTVEILVANFLFTHIKKASYFTAWNPMEYTIEVKGIKYRRFEVTITNPKYDDIIPTILKYMPHMLVESSDELKEAIDKRIKNYVNQYKI